MKQKQSRTEVWLPLVALFALCLPVLVAWQTPAMELVWTMLLSICG